jgi:CheY-like chemotaxis protein
VDVVLLDLTMALGSQDESLDRFRALYAQTPDLPIIVLCNREDESLAQTMVRAGATNYVIREECAARLAPLVRSVAKPARREIGPGTVDASGDRDTGSVIAFLGVKGGVGTTSVAANVAASLAHRSTVVIVELHSTITTLSHTPCPKSTIRTISSILKSTNSITRDQLQACLWPHRRIPGLSILFGPQNLQECVAASPDHVKASLTALSGWRIL